ncbi:MAG: hypothetical protein K0S45_4386 [Nitrospira sp.]|nr:hypothetical protein [Nitrospira sp.]
MGGVRCRVPVYRNDSTQVGRIRRDDWRSRIGGAGFRHPQRATCYHVLVRCTATAAGSEAASDPAAVVSGSERKKR